MLGELYHGIPLASGHSRLWAFGARLSALTQEPVLKRDKSVRATYIAGFSRIRPSQSLSSEIKDLEEIPRKSEVLKDLAEKALS